MMTRQIRWILPPVLLVTLLAAGYWGRVNGQAAQSSGTEEVASLKDQLEKGLKARRPIEFQFVARIALLVDNGQLTSEFVQGTFSWTRKKYGNRKYLVPYFEQVLRQRAAMAKITVLNDVPTTLTKVE